MYSSVAFALLGLSSIASSHMIMKTPTPFAASKLAGDNGPLLPDGSNFPCKVGYDAEGASNVMPLGSKQELSFVGGATHGGGSCQVSITYDTAPTKSSKFKVIHSIIGGCPARNAAGNIGTSAKTEDPDKYEFSIPDNLPPGDAVLAWTWFNKIGNREMYMNCAPVKLTGGGATRRDLEKNETLIERGMEAFDALPDMFVANIGNGCTTKDSTDLKFDNPGKSVDMISSSSLAGPVGSCASSGSSSSTSSAGGSGGANAGAGAGAGTGSSGAGASGAGASGAGASGAGSSGASGAGASGAGSSGASGAGSSGAGASGAGSSGAGASGAGASGAGASGAGTGKGTGTNGAGADAAGSGAKPEPSKDASGGAFYTVTSPETSKQTATSQDQSPAGKAPEPKPTSSAASDAKPSNSPSTEGSPKSEGSSAPASGGATNGSSGTGASQKSVGSQCSNEGAWNCIDGKSYQRCASGIWSTVMPLAAGTTCNSNTAEHMVIEAKTKRAARAPRAHLRRHINRMKFA